MQIVHVSAECYPVAKVGGLADVVGSLPKYLTRMGIDNKVVMPFYQKPFVEAHEWEEDYVSYIQMGENRYEYKVLKEKYDVLGFGLYLIQIEHLLDRDQVYGYHDDTYRFLAFQIAVLDWLNQWEVLPSVVHCHDHQAGLIPFFMKHGLQFENLKLIPSIITIHNAAYQGWIKDELLPFFPWFDEEYRSSLYWDFTINSLACAIRNAWKVTTVSNHYMWELSQDAHGLESLIRAEYAKCSGIVNGIDTEEWNPKTDPNLVKNYGVRDFKSGKQANKEWICKEYNLDPKKPLISFIGRFAAEKGADLLMESIWNSLRLANQKVNYFIVGNGDSNIENGLRMLQEYTKGEVNTYFGYNEALARKVYAGSDFLLMPSRVEPCGLNQLYAIRYGTIPITRTVGGLIDTVIDFDDPDGYGIRFIHADKHDIAHAVSRAEYLYHNPERFREIRKRMMQLDFSWEYSAQMYEDLYESLTNVL